jgi:hypothetical protein
MTDLPHIALAFAREVLGWERPTDRKYGQRERDPFGKPSKTWTPYIFDFYGKHPQFHYTDLNAVMEAVRGWRDQTQEALDEYVTVTLSCASGEFIGHAFVGRGKPTTSTSLDPCHALMSACLAAARKLKAA